MSSPSHQPENAAYAARVSESLPVAPTSYPGASAASPAVANGAANATATDEHPFSCTVLTGSPPTFDHALCTTTAASPPESDISGVLVTSSTPPSSGDAAGHGDQVHKRPRPPLAVPRSNGPSLLTQALASARGILPSATAQTDQRLSGDNAQPNDLPSHPTQSHHASGHSQELAFPEPRYEDSLHFSGASSIPATSQRRIDAARAISSPIVHPSARPIVAPATSESVAMPGVVDVTLTGTDQTTPFSMCRMRGRSLGRAEQDVRLHEINSVGLPLGVAGDTAYSHGEGVFSHYKDAETNTESRAEYRAWRSDKTVPMGPEKAWSIGVEDVAGHQDGQVEKSIAEVLAGMEPTRSRKASHSLRFFKEGLPAEKGKRKDPKITQPEKTSPSKGQPVEGQQTTRVLPNQRPTVLSSPDELVTVEETQVSPHAEHLAFRAHTTEAMGSNNKGDSFDAGENEPTATESRGAQNPTEQFVPSLVLTNGPHIESKEMELAQGIDTHNSAELAKRITSMEEAVEDGEESSEEKISSAVFLPHQSLEDSGERSCVIEKVEPQHSSARSSTAKDFHPWLVKADEPEVASKGQMDAHSEDPLKGKKDGLLRDRELPNKEDHEDAVPNQTEPMKTPCDIPAMNSQPARPYCEDLLHEHQLAPKVPLEAIELIPYKHQVGGHTTIWRFSKRAVCKQLNNRENEFYEKIERYHRDLLPFLPRYIGVLNVTYQKQPRRKSTVRKEDNSGAEKVAGESDIQSNGPDTTTKTRARPSSNGYDDENQRRIVSQSLRSGHIPVPTVTFVDNQHILPRSLLQPSMVSRTTERPRSASAAMVRHRVRDMSSPTSNDDASRFSRPTLEDRHANSWGATMVNKKLRNEVFNDAFLKQPITVHKHHRPASYHRSVPRHSAQSKSVTAIPAIESERVPPMSPIGPSHLRTQVTLLQSYNNTGLKSDRMTAGNAGHVKDVTGTSAPEADVLGEKLSPRLQKRRYSGSKLRRKPQDVGDARGDLKYFEDADDVRYRCDGEAVSFSPLLKAAVNNEKAIWEGVDRESLAKLDPPNHPAPSALPPAVINMEAELEKIPRPVNPKEAQTQHDSRVEYFLLLEDLTAGMKRPCIMDLKMGTRQYGVDASAKKRESQRRKCAETTSRELGVRVCGLQTWDAKSEAYVFRDKYYGRDLKTGKELQDTLTMFLYDGVDYSSVLRHIPTILQKLNQLEVTIRRLRGYRFYAASLLMFYDAATPEDGEDTAAEDSTTDFATDTEDMWDVKRHQKSKAEIDFKMADFANSVTAGDLATDKPCPPRHPDEPDLGFLRGLATLRKYFLRIQRDVRNDMGLNRLRKQGEDVRGMENDYEELSVSE